MVDFVTQSRLYGYRYNSPEKREPVSSNRDLNRESGQKLFKTPRVQVHDCREDVMKDYSDPHLWDAWLFSSGLRKTYEGATELHTKGKTEEDGNSQNKTPDKLLYHVGQKGHLKEELMFPRSIATTEDGDILVADSGNHRIQRYSQCGVFISTFGEKGAEPGQFRNPTGVALLTNGCVVVADRRNKRIQILSESGEHKYDFKTIDEPFYVQCDAFNNIVVSSSSGTVEIYRRPANLWYRFKIPTRESGGQNVNMSACPITINNKDEVLVSNISTGKIQYFSYSGQMLYEFRPDSNSEGLACQPAGICLDALGQIFVADCLNHVINLYSERGSLLSQYVGPTDNAGAVQSVAVGAEGHLVASEYTTNGTHCLKIFRYRQCECHPIRPVSSKRTSFFDDTSD